MAVNFRAAAAVTLVAAAMTAGAVTTIATASGGNRGHDRAPSYARNASGQTYGSARDATSPDTEPDLIEAFGVDGTRGYVRKTDLNGPSFVTPEQAVAHQNARPAGARRIPLYAVDGRTVIGAFDVDPGVAGP